LKRILATGDAHTYVTKVPIKSRRFQIVLLLYLALLHCVAASAEASSADNREPGPAKSLYLQLNRVGLDPTRVFGVREISLDRPAIHITLEDGTIAFTQDVMGKITGAFFEGDGEVLLAPPNDVERKSMSLFTGMAILEERFSTAYFRFNDNTAADLQPGLRAPQDAAEFVTRWNDTARALAHADAMRLLSTFSRMLPRAGATTANSSAAAVNDSADRWLHARLQGNKLGAFDIFFDATAGEQVEAGQAKSTVDGNLYFNVWTSFAIEDPGARKVHAEDTPPILLEETGPQEDPVRIRNYLVNARVKPPKELDAEVKMQLEVLRGGSRSLVFELSRYLQIQSVESEGKAVEFIQNPAVEGTQLDRSGNDLVAVVLPEPAQKGKKINLRFVYAGEVLAEAGPGLLYVGARGNWYPNRGLVMADFDLTFRYPPGWTLVATGKPAPVSTQDAGEDQVSRWVSERPIPVAGFDLGKYVRAATKAGNVMVETYATAGVERDFPKASPQAAPPNPASRPGTMLPIPVIPLSPSPARNAMDVAEATAQSIRYYAEHFGPFPYSKLAVTQLPGRDSQGWPGLIFLSSYAFLTAEESETLHTSASHTLDHQIPAHEAAHQWWGDLVTWSSYRDQWFSEGLANYCSLMMLQEKNPVAFRQIMEKYRQDLVEADKAGSVPKDAGPVTLGNRLLSSQFPEAYRVVTYGRGTWLFHMLRSMMLDAAQQRNGLRSPGEEEPFLRSLRKLRERYQGKTISTKQLLSVFAENLPASLRYEGKASLDWFLEGWINGTSLPKLELQAVKFAPKANEVFVTGVIRQKDAPEDLVTSVPLYAVISGKAPILLGRVFADGAESSFRLSAPLGTHKLLLDPNGTILTHPK
jgi:hypothetical protein